VKRFLPVVSIVAALMLGSCGHRSAGLPIQQLSGNPPSQQTLAELDALACPDGVDAALWEELKEALEEALRSLPEPRLSSRASTAPTGGANRVDDLGISDNGGGTYTLTWHYRNLGDYDQDGTVGIEDLTPLAVHFGEIVPEDDLNRNSLPAVIDGSGNGVVDIADVTPIAQNFGIEVADYIVEEATGADAGRAVFTHIFTPGENAYFRVTARDEGGTPGDPSNTVGIALQILGVTPTEVKEGTVVTFGAEVLGAGPLSYEWDFGGGAQYEAYTGPSPRVVLTRETGEFPASLTVTGPTGADTYPFTLSKLTREWKYEVVLANADGDVGARDLQEHDGKLWFFAYEGYDYWAGDAARKWIVSGTPGNWEFEPVEAWGSLRISEGGTLGVVGVAGPFLDKTLTLWEKRGAMWTKEELVNYGLMSRVSFTYSGEEPVVTFTLPGEPSGSWIEYFWRKNGQWERGIVDEPGYVAETGLTTVSATDPEGNPAVCYSAYVETPEGTHLQFRVGWWDNATDNWDIIPVESSWENGGVTCGLFPALGSRPDGRLAVTFARFSPDLANDQLAYAIYDGSSWQKELVEELPTAGTTNQYSYKALTHDPNGNPLIAFAHVTRTDDVHDCGAWAYFFNGAAWDTYVLDESGVAESAPSAVFDECGTPYVLFTDKASKEVIIAYYE